MFKHVMALLCVGLFGTAAVLAAESSSKAPAQEGASAYFISPQNNAIVSSPVTVRFGLSGMGVAPAGVERANTGHHHLIIDAKLPPLNQAVPADEKHRHFGGGQTETTIELTPGKHTLQLLLGDQLHRPHQPAVTSEVITIMVK